MSGYTLAPVPGQVFLDNTGHIMPGGKLFTYLAGTSTPNPTYTSQAGNVANTNPIVFDGFGRPPQDIFLPVGVTQKWVLTDADGVTLRTYPTVAAVPEQAANVDIPGTAGVAFALGDPAYLSDGSGGLLAGKWYKADAAFTYASTTPLIGFATTAIPINGGGVFRVSGSSPTAAPVVPGTIYYIASGGGLTPTPPTNRRAVGQADTVGTIILGDVSPFPAATDVGVLQYVGNGVTVLAGQPLVVSGRLTLTTGNPFPTADVAAATSVFWTPAGGSDLPLYTVGSGWRRRTYAQIAQSLVGFTASKPYDFFAWDNNGVVTLETVIWNTTVLRFASGPYSILLPLQDGMPVKSGNGTTVDPTRLYLGTVHINAAGGQSDATLLKQYLYNRWNQRVRMQLRREPQATWTYNVNTYRQMNNNPLNQLEMMNGEANRVAVRVLAYAADGNGNTTMNSAVGEDSTTVPSANALLGGHYIADTTTPADVIPMPSELAVYSVGYHFYAALEKSSTAGVTTWYGTGIGVQAGLVGESWG